MEEPQTLKSRSALWDSRLLDFSPEQSQNVDENKAQGQKVEEWWRRPAVQGLRLFVPGWKNRSP